MGQSFTYHLNFTHHLRTDADVWQLNIGEKGYRRYVKKVVCRVETRTHYKGATAPQPRAVVRGTGKVRIRRGIAYITSG